MTRVTWERLIENDLYDPGLLGEGASGEFWNIPARLVGLFSLLCWR